MSNGSKFFESLACSIAAGATVATAAKQASCSASHAYRLSNQPEFRSRVSALRLEATDRAVGALSDAATAAVTTLISMLDPDYEASVRLQASKAILSSLSPMAELSELRQRVAKLEHERESVK